MKKKYKLKKSAIVILILSFIALIVLINLIISLFKKYSYSIEYNIGEYSISENYNKENSYYYYTISTSNLVYDFIYESNCLKEKKLIKEIKEYNDEDYTCIIIKSNYLDAYPMCNYKEEYIDYHLIPDNLKSKLSEYYKSSKEVEKTYDNYKLYNEEENLLIWSYKGFKYIHQGKLTFIKIFNKDIYEIPLATKINNYILIPDYEQEYNFNKVYLINLDTLEVDEWSLKYSISYDSYILGTNDKSLFIIDKKNEKEYELVPHKKKMRIVATSNQQGIIYEENQISKISMKKLISKEYSFTYKALYNYKLKNNSLYLNYIDSLNMIKISNKKVDYIVASSKENIYYLVEDTLYRYNPQYGEVKLISYSEWKFNYRNLIFINS